MKQLFPYALLLSLLTTATSCHKHDDDQPSPAICPMSCPDAGDVIKTVSDVRGIVRQSPLTQEYAITTYPTVTNGIDVGVLCAPLPASLQVAGTKVIFSGTYRRKPGETTGSDVATFYLNTSKVSLDPNP